MVGESRFASLVVDAGSRICAIPLAHVSETMRPLPVKAVAGMPECVQGLSVIRGIAVPVIDLGTLMGGMPLSSASPTVPAGRFVSLHLGGGRLVAVAVDRVVGLRELDVAALGAMPPLLRDSNAGVTSAIAALDSELLHVLSVFHIVSDELWQRFDREALP